jgi:hypothetical protein
MTSSAVCALTMLAFLLAAALLTATANVAGSGDWPSSLATRTVTSYLVGGLSMTSTISVILGYLLNRSRSAINTTESAGQVGIQPSEADSDGKALTCAAPVT